MQTLSKLIPDHYRSAIPLFGRSAVFLTLFIIASGLIGSRIIGNGLSGSYGFQIYGGAGKSLLLGVLALLLMVCRKGNFPKLRSRGMTNLLWLIPSLISLYFGWEAVGELIGHARSPLWPLIANLSIILSVLFLMLFSFGAKNLQSIRRAYSKELLFSAGIALAFFAFLYLIYELWAILAVAVLGSVKALLLLVGVNAMYLPPRTLLLDKFGITITEFCSGIDSIALFSALYALIGVLDWRRFNHKRYLVAFVPGLMILFGFNIFRVFVLILGGYYINAQIAFSLFHTYVGMVFFIIYSCLFWAVTYGWLIKDPSKVNI